MIHLDKLIKHSVDFVVCVTGEKNMQLHNNFKAAFQEAYTTASKDLHSITSTAHKSQRAMKVRQLQHEPKDHLSTKRSHIFCQFL